MYTKSKTIAFKLEGRELEKLTSRAGEFGVSLSIFAKKLVTDNLEKMTHEELVQQFELLENKIEFVTRSVLNYVKEVFYVLSDMPREQLDEILSEASQRN